MEDKKDYSSFGWAEAATPDDIINAAIRLGIENMVNTSSIARVTAVNENTVDLELLNGDKVINVPLCASSFNGWTISLPIKKDDTGIVFFTKYEISNYKSTGQFSGDSLSPYSQNNGVFVPFALFKQPAINDDIIITNEKIKLTINADNEVLFTCEKDSGILTINFNKDNEIDINNEKASVLIDKDGGVTVTCESDISIDTKKDVNITCNNASIEAKQDVDIACNNASIETQANAEIKATGNVTVEGATVAFCGATAAQGAVAVGSPCPLTGTHSKGSTKVFAPGM